MITAKIIADSVSDAGHRITTLQLCYPRFIHAEFMTHRVFSRNASSSRAIPVKKMLEMVRNEPAMPIHWGANIPGMQAHEELDAPVCNLALFGTKVNADVSAREAWIEAAARAADVAEKMMEAGYHKQVVNRLLEPFQHIHVVVTATEWDNFFALRDHPDAQPEIHELAIQMRKAMNLSVPKLLSADEWHLPYVTDEERADRCDETLVKISAARCCRVSYLKHDGSTATIEEDIDLCHKLAGSVPIHASPFEHQATPFKFQSDEEGEYDDRELMGNFYGWIQNRKVIEQEFIQGEQA
jgi:thymidylate synthase ThyX